jgi:hypothetical protein
MSMKRRIGGYILEMHVYLHALRHGRALDGKTRFYIFGQGRTGSTLLVTMLDSHPQVHCEDELLFHPRLLPMQYVRGKCGAAREPVVGFHVKCYQLTRDQAMKTARPFVDQLEQAGWKMIFLRREQVLKHAISPILAKARNLWHIGQGNQEQAPPEAVSLNPAAVVGAIRGREKFARIEAEIVRDYDHLPIVYEQDLSTPEQRAQTSTRLCDYLGIESRQLSSPLKATTSKSIISSITNFDEIATAIRKEGLGHYLEDVE